MITQRLYHSLKSWSVIPSVKLCFTRRNILHAYGEPTLYQILEMLTRTRQFYVQIRKSLGEKPVIVVHVVNALVFFHLTDSTSRLCMTAPLQVDSLLPSTSFFLLLLLLSRFSPVWLLATPQTAAYQVPPSMGFSRQEYWSGVPLPSPSLRLCLS